MCVFRKCPEHPSLVIMNWRLIRLELASSWEFPRGSAGRSYLIRLPLTDNGAIDTETLEQQPARATVRRHWPNQADMLGYLVRTSMGYAIRYETNGHFVANDDDQPTLFQFGAEEVRIGEQIFLAEPDGSRLRFRIASLQ